MSLRRHLMICLMAGSGLLSNSATYVTAQVQYATMPAPAAYSTKEGAAAVNSAVKTAVKETGGLSAASKDAIKTMTEVYMAKMTAIDPNMPPEKARGSLQNLLLSISADEGRTTAAKTVVSKATEIIDGNYMPAAKINAMVAMAEVDEGPKNATKPSADALRQLYSYATRAELPCHLRSLALAGLDRHVQKGGKQMPAGARNSVALALVKIVSSQPTNIPQEKAHWWMVRRAYDVLGSLHTVSVAAGDKSAPALDEGKKLALDHFLEPTTVPSVRLSAGLFLTRFDFSDKAIADDITRTKLFVALAQLLDQEVVGWYEHENEKTKMASGIGGMGGMGMGMGMGDMGSTMMGGGMDAGSMGGYDSMMGGANGGSGSGSGTAGPRPIDVQKWDLRLARRKLNTYCQLAHVLLKGNATADETKDFSPTGKGVMESDLPDPLKRTGKQLLEALEKVQVDINERSLTTVSTLMTRVMPSLQTLRDVAENTPGIEAADGAIVVPSFDQLSPRKKSLKKADASGSLDAPKPAQPADAPAVDGAAPADGAAPVQNAAPVNGAANPNPPANPNMPANPNAPVNSGAPASGGAPANGGAPVNSGGAAAAAGGGAAAPAAAAGAAQPGAVSQ